ncbi:hypothetical protein [Paenibacillus terrigena]|uniref:hypothetical protein n=1 Tax=Paenibacillus terrigena TaxID=369333 RepID=UPI0028D3AC64|nr:hypothetical protein [Paenibacillus terrigena]
MSVPASLYRDKALKRNRPPVNYDVKKFRFWIRSNTNGCKRFYVSFDKSKEKKYKILNSGVIFADHCEMMTKMRIARGD